MLLRLAHSARRLASAIRPRPALVLSPWAGQVQTLAARSPGASLPCTRATPPPPLLLPPLLVVQSALVHLGVGEWEKLVADMQALDLLRPGTDK